MKLLSIFLFVFLTHTPRYPKYVCVKPEDLSWDYYEAKSAVSPGHPATTASFFVILPDLDAKHPVKRVAVYFITDSSWVDRKKFKIWPKDYWNNLRKHEVNHYNIQIVYAKKFQKALQTLPLKSPEEIYKIHVSLFRECHEINRQYDIETDGSNNHLAQMTWNVRIKQWQDSVRDVELTWGVKYPYKD